MKKKCYTYIRVSTSMQVEGYSLEAQRDRLNKFAEFQDMEVVREYCDAGKSGKSISGRPEFTKMLQDVASEKDNISYILVFKLSRFGRNAADVLNSLQHIQDFGVNLICVEDGIDSSKDSGKLTITVLSAVAEIERENILVQTMEGRRQKAREGKWNGGPAPLGYDLDKKNDSLAVNLEEAEIVKIIFNKYVNEHMGMQAISNYLNQHGYEKKKKRPKELNYFTPEYIRKILDNPIYIGKITYGKSTTEKIKGTRDQYHRVKSEEYLSVDGRHEAIIDLDTWELAKSIKRDVIRKPERGTAKGHEYLLTGLIKCPKCGRNMSGTIYKWKNKKNGECNQIYYYRCLRRRKMDDENFCDFQTVLNEEDFLHEVENYILDLVNNEEGRKYILQRMSQKVDISSLLVEQKQLKEQLRQHLGAKDKLMMMLDRLDVSDRHYNRKYQDMHDRLDNLYDRIDDVEDTLAEVNEKIEKSYESQITAQQVYAVLQYFDIMYYEMDAREKKEFFKKFIESIELYKEKMYDGRILKQINFKFPVRYDGEEVKGICLRNENTVETVVLMSNRF